MTSIQLMDLTLPKTMDGFEILQKVVGWHVEHLVRRDLHA